MGQAKQRGTFEQRRKQAIARRAEERAEEQEERRKLRLAEQRRCDHELALLMNKMSPEEREEISQKVEFNQTSHCSSGMPTLASMIAMTLASMPPSYYRR